MKYRPFQVVMSYILFDEIKYIGKGSRGKHRYLELWGRSTKLRDIRRFEISEVRFQFYFRDVRISTGVVVPVYMYTEHFYYS